jgi:hypothetical protein
MIEFKYGDLTDSSTITYRTFNRHHEAIERLEKKLEREKAIINGLTAVMQERGAITSEQYDAVIAWMVHSSKSWSEISILVFKEHRFPSIYEN